MKRSKDMAWSFRGRKSSQHCRGYILFRAHYKLRKFQSRNKRVIKWELGYEVAKGVETIQRLLLLGTEQVGKIGWYV